MNREEVMQKIEPAMNLRVRTVDRAAGTRVVATADRVAIRPSQSGRYIEFTEEGVQSLASFIKVVWPVAKNLTPDTFGRVATELIQKQNQFALVVRDDAVTGVINGGNHLVDTDRALATIERTIPGVDYHRALVDGTTVELEVVGEQQQPVVRGDLIRAGALVRFSPVGTVRPFVQSYALRLACTNGATANTVLREFRFAGGGGGEGGDGGGNGNGNFWAWFRKSVHDAYGALENIVQQYQRMLHERVPADQRAAMLEGMLRQAHITGSDAEAVRAMALQSPPTNGYEMFNLLTYATSHILRHPRAIAKAREITAQYSSEEEHEAVCPVCHGHRRARPQPQVVDAS
jgi:hypothetical protein